MEFERALMCFSLRIIGVVWNVRTVSGAAVALVAQVPLLDSPSFIALSNFITH